MSDETTTATECIRCGDTATETVQTNEPEQLCNGCTDAVRADGQETPASKGNQATYSSNDNKIRLYVGRVPRAKYEELRDAGFISTPKQDCDFVATWTPRREDIALSFLDDDQDIDDEDQSPEERAADRAERFGGYRDKRRAEAHGHADTFENGPQVFGHQSAARAERQANRHDRHRGRATSQWAKAEYWQQRTAGVIAHALHRSSPAVRRSRILRLEAEQRKHDKSREEYVKRYVAWSKVAELAATPNRPMTNPGTQPIDTARRIAYDLANCGAYGAHYKHPRTGQEISMSQLLGNEADPITPAEAAALWLEGRADPTNDTESDSARWSNHYANRLNYEKAMLANEGGTAAEADMEPGGWIRGVRTHSVLTDCAGGWLQIHRVHKSPATKRVTSVQVMGTTSGFTAESEYTKHETKATLVTVNIERLPEGSYRPPTAEEREAFKQATNERKAEAKASKPEATPLINPTDADAQRLQDLLNEKAKEKNARAEPSSVLRLTQDQYSARSKGAYASFETRTLYSDGKVSRRSSNMWTAEGAAYDKTLTTPAAKVRMTFGKGFHSPSCVIVITDKPQKPLPLEWEAIANGTAGQPNTEPVTIEHDEPAPTVHAGGLLYA